MQLLTVEGWAGVIADLQSKQQAAREHAEQLQAQKHALALESAMGSPEAKKALTKINAELSRLALEGDDWHAALTQAEASKKLAEQAEAETADRQRQAELSKLATTVIGHAAAYTKALREAVDAGERLKQTIRQMIPLARPDEMANLNRILEAGCWMRCAQFAGLRTHIDFRPYVGPAEHLGPLETELAVYLGKWLNNTNGKE